MGIWTISEGKTEENIMPVKAVAEVFFRKNRPCLSAILETGFTAAEAVKNLHAISARSRCVRLAGDCPAQSVHPLADAG